ncbi:MULTISPECIES: hypothetical protein [unclassified Streptomyces]|uniref:hypothetical protein n=1 Tax=unclassified Streptomyces TaxID=2593676 RepID=UPI002E75D618|nr:hypothetical protein [Streptomyces sp. JV176]MEE1800371.1 hypothetical protein [Streptomyces sp. JV176]
MNDHRTHRFLGTVLPALLVAGALGGGFAFVRATVDGADRSVSTRVWAESQAKPAKDPAGPIGKGRADTDLTRKLLPVPPGYVLGPDTGAYGNDAELTGEQAIDMMKAAVPDVPPAVRREVDKEIDRMGIDGLGLRSYTFPGNALTVDVSLIAVKDADDARRWYQDSSRRSDGEREGPAIEGRKNASCSVQTEKSESEGTPDIGTMTCLAYEGELVVIVVAQGMPIDQSTVAELVKDQLDRLAAPGENV